MDFDPTRFFLDVFGDEPGDELADDVPFFLVFPNPLSRRGEDDIEPPLRGEEEPDDEDPPLSFLPPFARKGFFLPNLRLGEALLRFGFDPDRGRCPLERDLLRRPRTPFSIWANSIHCCAACTNMGAGPSCSMRSSKSPMDGA